jgi:hypothetical protein
MTGTFAPSPPNRVKSPAQADASQNTATGSGPRHCNVTMPIKSNAPADAHTMDRNSPKGEISLSAGN